MREGTWPRRTNSFHLRLPFGDRNFRFLCDSSSIRTEMVSRIYAWLTCWCQGRQSCMRSCCQTCDRCTCDHCWLSWRRLSTPAGNFGANEQCATRNKIGAENQMSKRGAKTRHTITQTTWGTCGTLTNVSWCQREHVFTHSTNCRFRMKTAGSWQKCETHHDAKNGISRPTGCDHHRRFGHLFGHCHKGADLGQVLWVRKFHICPFLLSHLTRLVLKHFLPGTISLPFLGTETGFFRVVEGSAKGNAEIRIQKVRSEQHNSSTETQVYRVLSGSLQLQLSSQSLNQSTLRDFNTNNRPSAKVVLASRGFKQCASWQRRFWIHVFEGPRLVLNEQTKTKFVFQVPPAFVSSQKRILLFAYMKGVCLQGRILCS